MKILLLSDANSSHTIKWVKALAEAGVTIHLMSLTPLDEGPYSQISNVSSESFNLSSKISNLRETNFSKIIYISAVKKIKKRIKEFNPDILHSHYVSSYGLLGALSNFHPFIVSVWGADIYNFPFISVIHKKIIQYVLKKADKILSTSNSMAMQVKKFTNKEVEVTPFGIDTELFNPAAKDEIYNSDEIIIGTVKTLEQKYGIEYLIKAFKIVKEKVPEFKMKLLIVGGGNLELPLKNLTTELGLADETEFTGYVNYHNIIKYHNQLDIYVALSIEDSESFGVAVLEASACGKPVVVSNVSGFTEVVEKNVTGIIVQRKNIAEAADAIVKLVKDKNLRKEMGIAGRDRVLKYYNWKNNVDQMYNIYCSMINSN